MRIYGVTDALYALTLSIRVVSFAVEDTRILPSSTTTYAEALKALAYRFGLHSTRNSIELSWYTYSKVFATNFFPADADAAISLNDATRLLISFASCPTGSAPNRNESRVSSAMSSVIGDVRRGGAAAIRTRNVRGHVELLALADRPTEGKAVTNAIVSPLDRLRRSSTGRQENRRRLHMLRCKHFYRSAPISLAVRTICRFRPASQLHDLEINRFQARPS